jgi:hypothetical protein
MERLGDTVQPIGFVAIRNGEMIQGRYDTPRYDYDTRRLNTVPKKTHTNTIPEEGVV